MFCRTTRLLLLAVSATLAIPAGAAEPAPGGHWPQWRGPDRTNVSTETGLLNEWPAGGPPLAWKADRLGDGVPSVAVAGGKVYVLGNREGMEVLTAFGEADGKKRWSVAVGPAVTGGMPIMRWLSQRTPTVDGDRVYAVTGRGELTCLATTDGAVQWRKDYVKDFQGRPGRWGYCDFPLADGDRLICTPCGPNAALVALDKKTGAAIWTCAVPGEPRSTYSGVVTAEIGGVRQYVHQFETDVVGVAAADGRLLWRSGPYPSALGNVHTPLVRGDRVFVSWGNPGGGGAALLKVTPAAAGFKVAEVYKTSLPFDAWLASSVRLGEYVHAANGLCIEWNTGRLVQKLVPPQPPAVAGGRPAAPVARFLRMTMTCADGRLYHRTGNNAVTLTEVTAAGAYVKRGEFTAPKQLGGEPTWTFPVVAGGRLYLRDQDVLLCYDVRAKAAPRRPDVIFVPTPQDVVEKMLDLAGVTKDDVVADLGCGDGRIVVTAAKAYGCKAVGYDLDKECVRLSLENVAKEGVEKLVRIQEEDILAADLRGVTVVTLYLGPAMNVKLVPQLEKLKPGARIVSHAFDMPGVVPDKVIDFRSAEDDIVRKLYLWTTPLKKERK
jgi:outer membrane protein assembly factor BamB